MISYQVNKYSDEKENALDSPHIIDSFVLMTRYTSSTSQDSVVVVCHQETSLLAALGLMPIFGTGTLIRA